MATITDRLDAMSITATSPDSQIKAVVRHPGTLTLHFAPGTYAHYDEATLAHQLSQLATLCMAGYVRGYREATGRATTMADDRPDPKKREYRRELKELGNYGVSDGNNIKVRATGMMGWEVRIRPGTVARLSGEEFSAEAASALRKLVSQHRREVTKLKDKHFDLGLPKFLRKLPPPPPGY